MFAECQGFDERTLRSDPTETHPGVHDLREGVHVDHPRVEAREGGLDAPFEAEILVSPVFDHDDPEAIADVEELVASFGRQAAACGVLETRNDVEELRQATDGFGLG